MKNPKHIAILGSTGSIGCQALEVVSQLPDAFKVEVLTAQSNVEVLVEQAMKHRPKMVIIGDERYYGDVKGKLSPLGIQVGCGKEALSEAAQHEDVELVLTALVGYSGLLPTIKAIQAGKDIALANKETLVVAGELITRLAREYDTKILPVDSEHSAIFQCLVGEFHNPIEKIILTASGGPFRGMKKESLQSVTKAEALKHPNWTMGSKVTIDSATMMNKGLEVIEAHWLFGVAADQLEVVIHPQSIVHSIVQFTDGSMKAQMGLPDMRLPIQYAMTYPDRQKSQFPRFDFTKYPSLNFETPDLETFRNLALAYEALNKGGNMPCILNAANEIAVDGFLKGAVRFLEIPDVVASCMEKSEFVSKPDYEEYVSTNREARQRALEYIGAPLEK